MYSVFLVDDEPIVLEGIRNKIDWESSGFTFAGEATDGEIAFSMIQEIKPDILITDIKMPFMDGLQLASAIKKTQSWIKIIILSGHDEFDYAKKAISIGIEDYLLKPFTAEDILTSLKKAAAHLDQERTQLSDINKLKTDLKNWERQMQKEFLLNLVNGTEEMGSIMEKCTKLGLNLISRYYKVLISKISSKSGNENNIGEACSRLNSYSAEWPHTISFFHHSNQIICIFKGNTKEDFEENVYWVADSIEHIVNQNADCSTLTAIGKTVEHLSAISESYKDAKKLFEAGNFENQNRILSSDDIQMDSTTIIDLKESDPIVNRLRYAGKNDVSAIIDESVKLLESNPGQFSVFASYLLVDLIFEVSKLVENLGGNIKELKPDMLQHSYIDEAVENETNFISHLKEILNFAVDFRDSNMKGRYGEIIIKAKKYIEENYADQNMSLTTVAQEVCLSPNHFSTIFSQECKTTFIEYLTNIRIENAKKLIKNSDMKGYDIAWECGFSDPHYFSYIFKKNTGLSPREFKQQN